MVGPSLAVLAVVEPPRERPTQVWRPMMRDVAGVLFTKSGITGMLLMLSPVGTAALTNSFTAIKADYHTDKLNGRPRQRARRRRAQRARRVDRRHAVRSPQPARDVLALRRADRGVALVIAEQAPTREVYIVGVSVYNLVTGFCFAAFTATVLETIGHGDAAAGTKYTLFTAAGNIAITYTNFVDTHAYAHWSNSSGALFACDALQNIAGVVVLGAIFWRLRTFGASRHPPERAKLPVARVHDDGSSP